MVHSLLTILISLLAGFGLFAIVIASLLSVPLRRPAPLDFIENDARTIDQSGLPDIEYFQARDGTWLAYRFYHAHQANADKTILLIHGSSASSFIMNAIGKALALANINSVALDIRGHGKSGQRGDIGYLGQLEDDISDLIATLRKDAPKTRLILLGSSLGGGFIVRLSSRPLAKEFEKFILLGPFLGPSAPTSGPGNKAWAKVNLPRIIALVILNRLGITIANSWPVIAYANHPDSSAVVTSVYSYRLLADFGPDFDWSTTKAHLAAAAPKFSILVGEKDELMTSSAFTKDVQQLGVSVQILPDLRHIDILHHPQAIAAIVDAVRGHSE